MQAREKSSSIRDFAANLGVEAMLRLASDGALSMLTPIATCTQSRSLATLRDTLMPKLLSGELSVAQTQN